MKLDVKHIAKLANLPLTDEEIKKFEPQLTETLNYIQELEEIDTKNVKETSQVTGLENVTRPDTPAPSLTQRQALANASRTKDGLFEVKGIFEDE